MAIALLPILMLIVGFVIYATVKSPPWVEFGRWIGFAGAIGIAVAYATHMVKIG